MTIAFDDSDLAGTRKANERLDRMPRLRLQSAIHRNLIQGLLGLANLAGPDLAARADRVTIGGESAGGHLAAATILRLRDAAVRFDRVKGAALTYGCYDLGGTDMRRRAGPETLVLHGPTMSRILDKARGVTAENKRDPRLSPLYADLTGLPPALFVVGTRDPLQEDTELMYAKWVRQSHNAELAIVPEAAHGFNKQPNSTAEKTNAYIRAWIGRHLAA